MGDSRKVVEADFQTRMLAALNRQGMRAIHVREANMPGVFDILCMNPLYWLELKVDSAVEPSQREWGRGQWRAQQNAFFLREQPDLGGRIDIAQGRDDAIVVGVTLGPLEEVQWAHTLNICKFGE